jgi:hypothetical protein
VGENFIGLIKHWKCELAYVGTHWFRLCEWGRFVLHGSILYMGLVGRMWTP